MIALQDAVELIPFLRMEQVVGIGKFPSDSSLKGIGMYSSGTENMVVIEHHGTSSAHKMFRGSNLRPKFLTHLIAPSRTSYHGCFTLLIAESPHQVEMPLCSSQHRLYTRSIG